MIQQFLRIDIFRLKKSTFYSRLAIWHSINMADYPDVSEGHHVDVGVGPGMNTTHRNSHVKARFDDDLIAPCNSLSLEDVFERLEGNSTGCHRPHVKQGTSKTTLLLSIYFFCYGKYVSLLYP